MRSLFVGLVFGCAAAAPVHAQFGIGKKIRTAAADAAGVSPTATGEVRTGRVNFNADVLEITTASLGQFTRGLEAEFQVLARMSSPEQERPRTQNEAAQAAYDRQPADYDRKSTIWERCADPERARGQAEIQGVAATAPDSATTSRSA